MTDTRDTLVRRTGLPGSVSRPVVNPIHPSVVWASPDTATLDGQYTGGPAGFTYAREGHPNWAALAAQIDRLEGAEGGIVTGSGMAAVGAMFLGVLQAGDHVVAGDQLYGRSLRLLKEELPRMGVEVTLVDPTDGARFAAAMRPETRLALVELVSNPTLRVADYTAIRGACRDRGVLLAVDNTFTTHRMFRPLAEGADIVMHSVTKLLAGHADATLGWVAAADPAVRARMLTVAVSWGLTPSPFDCWLAERGLHTFDLRFDRAQANAAALADRIAGHPAVAQVLYPGRPDHPDHNRAAGLMGGQGGYMLSFRLKGGRPAVDAFLAGADGLFFAPTLGDVATTVSHPPTSSHRALTPEGRAAIGIDEGFLRISVGIEEPGFLQAQFDAGLARAAEVAS